MWPFKRKSQPIPILRVLIGEEEILALSADELPVEKLPVVPLTANRALRFVDSRGFARAFDMSSAVNEGAHFLHMSIRVSADYAVQPDGILTREQDDDSQSAYKAGAKGLRFQPFLLPESSGSAADLTGRGLFYRGLHFSGTVTPGNVSLLCSCDHCNEGFRLQSFHAGFSNLVYFYCSGGFHTLALSSYEEDAPPVVGKADREALARLEGRLPKCAECGGMFKYLNPLLCPNCLKPYIDFPKHPADRESEYYGNYRYGGTIQQFSSEAQQSVQPDRREDAAPG